MTPNKNPLFNIQPTGLQPRRFDSSPAETPGAFVPYIVGSAEQQSSVGVSIGEMSQQSREINPNDLSPEHIRAFSESIAAMSGYTKQLRNDQMEVMGVSEHAA